MQVLYLSFISRFFCFHFLLDIQNFYLLYLHSSHYLFCMEFSVPISCISTRAFISESVIVSSSSPVPTGQLYALYRLAINIIFTILSLILNYPSLKLTVAVYKGLPIGHSLLCVPCDPYIPIQSSNII